MGKLNCSQRISCQLQRRRSNPLAGCVLTTVFAPVANYMCVCVCVCVCMYVCKLPPCELEFVSIDFQKSEMTGTLAHMTLFLDNMSTFSSMHLLKCMIDLVSLLSYIRFSIH